MGASRGIALATSVPSDALDPPHAATRPGTARTARIRRRAERGIGDAAGLPHAAPRILRTGPAGRQGGMQRALLHVAVQESARRRAIPQRRKPLQTSHFWKSPQAKWGD